MNVTIYPSRFILEKSFAGSTALTHRYLIASWLMNEGILFENVPENEDVDALFNFFNAIGKDIIYTNSNSLYIKPSKRSDFHQLIINVKDSVTTLLLLLPVSLQMAKQVIFQCDENLFHYSLTIYEQIAKDCNLSIQKKDQQIICSGSIHLDYYELEGNVSSLFIMGLIINALYQKKATTIKINPPFLYKDDVLTGILVFQRFGFDITINENTIYIHTNFIFQWDYLFIEADYETAANYFALACLNGSLLAYHFKEDSLQVNQKIIQYLKNMGGNIKFIKEDGQEKLYIANNALLEKGIAKQLRGCDFDLCKCMDLFCILMVTASFANGISRFFHLDYLCGKELERILKMVEFLKILHVEIKKDLTTITIKGKKDYFNKIHLPFINDVRILMAISIFALLNKGEIRLTNVENVMKMEPHFLDNLISGTKQNAIQID